jgi:excisionase family DNA binding protein
MLTVTHAAKRLRLSEDRVRKLLQEGRIVGAQKFGMVWVIPDEIVIDPPIKTEHRVKPKRK